MKILITILLILIALNVVATDYYVSSTGDGDTLQTIAEVNALTLSAGDNVYFKRGGEWYGTITVGYSGTSGNPITYGAYDSGADPIISGFTTITGWTDETGGIYSKVITSDSETNMVSVDGINTAMGREPDTGTYWTYETYTTTSKTDNQLSSTPDWDGAEIVYRPRDWTWETRTISSHSGTTITHSTGVYGGTADWGYFIQNDLETLDQFGEWYHDTGTGKFYMYFGTGVDPDDYTVKVATKDNVITNAGKEYITIENLDIQGSIGNAIYNSIVSDYFTIQNCSISFAGAYAIYINSENSLIDDNTIHDCASGAVWGNSDLVTVTNNTINRTGLIIGTSQYYSAIQFIGKDYCTFRYNSIDSVGWIGLYCRTGNYDTLQYNLINHTALILNDGAAIYTGNATVIIGTFIDHNIALNCIGYLGGSTTAAYYTSGIYLDETANGLTVTNNTAAYNGWAGIYLHYAHTNTIEYNKCFSNNKTGIYYNGPPDLYNNIIRYNQFVAKAGLLASYHRNASVTTPAGIGTLDYNVYARPISDVSIMATQYASYVVITLASWKSTYSIDANSVGTPVAITSDDDMRLIYNATKSSVVYDVTGSSVTGMDGTPYSSTIEIASFESIVIIGADVDLVILEVPPTPTSRKLYIYKNETTGKYYPYGYYK